MSQAVALPRPILELRDLVAEYAPAHSGLFASANANVRAVDGVSLAIAPGEILGLAGESGCGKSTLAKSVVGLVRPTSGQVFLDGIELTGASDKSRVRLRRKLQLVFQDPHASLNPRMTTHQVLCEAAWAHGTLGRREIDEKARMLMEAVGLAESLLPSYPHQLSGGEQQRLVIARALAVEPQVLIADEPVAALDVSIQSQVLTLLRRLRDERRVALLLIAHDLAVLRHTCDRIAVMYLGRIVEMGPAAELVTRPRHPYTQALVSAVPLPDPERERSRQRILLDGEPPSPTAVPPGCRFHPRCRARGALCANEVPSLRDHSPGHAVACHRSPDAGLE